MKKNNAFTLIELLVAVAVFAWVITASSGIFVASLRTQKTVLATRTLFDETSYIMEYISRALRMAKKDINGSCISPSKSNYQKTRAGNGLKFVNYNNICQEFFLDTGTGRLKEVKEGVENFLSSNDLQILAFNTRLAGESQDNDEQPLVTFLLDIKTKNREQPRIKIQSTISQRNLDVRY